MKWIVVLAGGLVLFSPIAASLVAEDRNLASGHPRPSYAEYVDREIRELAAAVRQSQPQMYRGGWEWDRLLSRYVDGGRKQENEVKIIRAYFLSMLDRYDAAIKAGNGETFTLFQNHRSWGSGGRMRIYAELVRQKAITSEQQGKFRKIVIQSLKTDFPDYSKIERGVNNRPYGINAGPALAVQMFPGEPNAIRHNRWLEALWRELTEYGDTTETNYYPYGPLFLHGLLDMAEGMGKLETERKFIYTLARRYLDYVHGGGVRGNPNSSANVIHDRTRAYNDPWNSEYYAGAERVNDGHVWYRFAKHFKDPEFLWASEQAVLGGRPPRGAKASPAYIKAYNDRYFWFVDRGIEPKVPAGGSKIGYYSPLKYKVPERLYLCPGRESGKPFVSYYIYDRNNNYMHYCDDADGRLYEYCVDGAKFLHTSGKYTSGRGGVADTAYDMLAVLPPDTIFPVGGRLVAAADTWKMASVPVKRILNCRDGPDSKNWFFDEDVSLFRRTDDPVMGFAHGNMDGYWYLNDDFHLTSLSIGTFDAPALIQNVRMSGPEGEKMLAAFNAIPDNLKVVLQQKEKQPRELKDQERKQVLAIVGRGGRRGGRCLRVNPPVGGHIALSLENLDEKFDGQNEYTRVSYDFKGSGGGIKLNSRLYARYFSSTTSHGSILVREALRAENRGQDSFGQFVFRNYYGARSTWTRQTVLTGEGCLVVRDHYVPCRDVEGYQAGPCWCLNSEGDIKKSNRNWFDAPARDHAWWQAKKKRILLYLHPAAGLTFGQVSHRASADIGGGVHNSFAKTTLKAGQPQVWLSVLVPFEEGGAPERVAARIKTSLDNAGNATARIGGMTVTIEGKGGWSVKRKAQ